MKKLYYYPVYRYVLFILLLSLSFLAAADENNLNNQQLLKKAEAFIIAQLNPDGLQQVEVEGTPVDERISIPDCPEEIEFSVSADALLQSNMAVKAQCPGSNWYMYIMVKATEIQQVVIANSALSPGTYLNQENLQVINLDKKRLRNTTFADIESVIGAKVKRRLVAGRPIEPEDLCFVCKGDEIIISAGSANMHIKTNGVALEDGNVGDSIKVKNSRSNKSLTAQIVNTSEVRVIF